MKRYAVIFTPRAERQLNALYMRIADDNGEARADNYVDRSTACFMAGRISSSCSVTRTATIDGSDHGGWLSGRGVRLMRSTRRRRVSCSAAESDPNATSAERQDQQSRYDTFTLHDGGRVVLNTTSTDKRPDMDIFLRSRRRYNTCRLGAPKDATETSATRSQAEKAPCPYLRHP